MRESAGRGPVRLVHLSPVRVRPAPRRPTSGGRGRPLGNRTLTTTIAPVQHAEVGPEGHG
ncbi:hypothetical protein A33M_3040 [Rhodovulum sp. PH10]|nr:hypothetical protein A33M_3040 [Rhodovulum sp. PH10]